MSSYLVILTLLPAIHVEFMALRTYINCKEMGESSQNFNFLFQVWQPLLKAGTWEAPSLGWVRMNPDRKMLGAREQDAFFSFLYKNF